MTTFRHRFAAIVGVAMMLSILLPDVASAQTGYPPGTTTVPAACTPGGVDVGVVAVGSTFSITICGPFRVGSTINLLLDGATVGVKAALANGSVVVVITITSQGVASVNDPVNAAIVCGTNTVVATGPSSAATTVSQTGKFEVQCATASSTGPLAFTGTNAMRAVAVALVLIVAGLGLVVLQRRRTTT